MPTSRPYKRALICPLKMTSQFIPHMTDQNQREIVRELADLVDKRIDEEEESVWEAWNRECNWTNWFHEPESRTSVIYQTIDDTGPKKICVCDIFIGHEHLDEGSAGHEQHRIAALDMLMTCVFGLNEWQDTIVTNAPIWRSARYRLRYIGKWYGEPISLVYQKPSRTEKSNGTRLVVSLDIGLSTSGKDVVWLPARLEMRVSDGFIRCCHDSVGYVLEETGNIFMHFRWRDREYLTNDRGRYDICRLRKLEYHSRCNVRHVHRLDYLLRNPWRCPMPSVDVLVIPTIFEVPLRVDNLKSYRNHDPIAKWFCRQNDYVNEWLALRNVFLDIYVACSRAARIIQRRWRIAISDPGYSLAKKRLWHEYEELSNMTV